MKIGDDVQVAATREIGTVHKIDEFGVTSLYWLSMAARGRSCAPIDLDGPFTSDELRTGRSRR